MRAVTRRSCDSGKGLVHSNSVLQASYIWSNDLCKLDTRLTLVINFPRLLDRILSNFRDSNYNSPQDRVNRHLILLNINTRKRSKVMCQNSHHFATFRDDYSLSIHFSQDVSIFSWRQSICKKLVQYCACANKSQQVRAFLKNLFPTSAFSDVNSVAWNW